MVALDITAAERESGELSPEHLEAAVRAMREDGFVVLNDVIDLAHLAMLRDRMLDDLPKILAREDAPYNWHTGNVQQDPPPFPPYLFRDILLNDAAIAVSRALLGPGLTNGFYSGNTSLPGGREQPVHIDCSGQLWPNLAVAPPPHGIVVQVPVVSMDTSNGSVELWPGTHRDTTVHVGCGDIKVPLDRVAKRREIVPPLQPSVRWGSILLRDIRIWHRGMPNHTDSPRPMLAMIHWIRWWNDRHLIPFPKGTEAFFEHPHLKTNARFVDGPIDYIHHSEAYEYEKES
jgi:ectoine hydroxylase-related dioxygenase (phytanoyl-CoA dioxygenase family)